MKETEESKFWAERNEQKDMEKIIREAEKKDQTPAVVDLFASPFYRRQLFGMIMVLSSMTSSFYTLMLWTPIYLSDLREIMDQREADFINLCVVTIHIFFVILGGKLSDKFLHRSDLIKIGVTAVIVACPVMFGMFECESKLGIFIAQVQFSACLSLVHGGIAAWEVELWMPDPSLSFTGVAVGHNISSTLFGGTMPMIATYLFYFSDNLNDDDDYLYKRLIPGLSVSFLGLIALYSIGFVVRHPHDLRTGDKQLRNISNLKKKIDKKKRQRDIEGKNSRKKNYYLPQPAKILFYMILKACIHVVSNLILEHVVFERKLVNTCVIMGWGISETKRYICSTNIYYERK